MTSEAERWNIGDRYYGVTRASTPDSFDLELERRLPSFVEVASSLPAMTRL